MLPALQSHLCTPAKDVYIPVTYEVGRDCTNQNILSVLCLPLHRFIALQIHILIFDRAPESLNKDIIHRSSTPVHTDRYVFFP